MEGESRNGVINISIDHMVLLKGARLVSDQESRVRLCARILLTARILFRTHRFILCLMQLNNLVQTVIEIRDLNSALRLIVGI